MTVSCLLLLNFAQLVFVTASIPDDQKQQSFDLCIEVRETPDCNTSLAEITVTNRTFVGPGQHDTRLYLFTNISPNVAEPLHKCGGRLPAESTYNSNFPTEIFIHGGADGVCKSAWMREMKEQLLQKGDYNIILVDWSCCNLPIQGANARYVGDQVAFVIRNIINQTGATPEKFHVIGHSFGAHSAGFAGKGVQGLGRVTGLDPDLLLYANLPPEDRLSHLDATIVDNIHTNGGECPGRIAYGNIAPLGHADFYVNGGVFQASCYYHVVELFLQRQFRSAILALEPNFCSHIQAIQYYKVSINSSPCQFLAAESDSYEDFLAGKYEKCFRNNGGAVMGMDFETYYVKGDEKRRKYFLKTSLTCPYIDNSYLKLKGIPENIMCKED